MDPEVVFGFGDGALGCCDNVINEKFIVVVVVVRVASELCDIIFKTWVLADSIAPNLIQLHDGMITVGNSTNGTINGTVFKEEDYKEAAYSYISFYILGIIAALVYWVFFFKTKEFIIGTGFILALVCDMPLMVSEMCLLRAGGVINWDEQKYDLILQVCFLVNVFIQVYCDIGRVCDWFKDFGKYAIFSHFIVLALDFLVVCLLYAPVMWAMAGFHVFERIRIGTHVKGLVTSQESRDALEVLMLIGSIGQWIIAVILIGLMIWFGRSCSKK